MWRSVHLLDCVNSRLFSLRKSLPLPVIILSKMELKEVLAITGKRGLYRFVARSRHGFVVEPLEGGARFAVSMMSRVSSLADIAMYMYDRDMPLADVYTVMLPHEEEIKKLDLNNPEEARDLYAQLFPNFNKEKVSNKHIVKAFQWFLILRENGVEHFKPEEKPSETEQK